MSSLNETLYKIMVKGILSGLRQFLATDNFGYFTTKAFFGLKIFTFLSWFFGHVSKRLDVTAWLTNNRNKYIAQYLEKVS